MKKQLVIILVLMIVIVALGIVEIVLSYNKPNSNNNAQVEGTCGGMALGQARQIASNICGPLKATYFCNENTNTWWFDLAMEKQGCAPACVVNTQTTQAEINWRCTGLVQDTATSTSSEPCPTCGKK